MKKRSDKPVSRKGAIRTRGHARTLIRYMAGNEDVDAMRAAGAPKSYSDTRNPLLTLVQELSQRKDCSQIYVQKEGLGLTLQKRPGSSSQ
jgi:hypothetical protein